MTKSLFRLLFVGTAAISVSIAGGCKHTPETKLPVAVPIESFTQTWRAPIKLDRNEEFEGLYLREEQVIAYTSKNRAIAVSAAGGRTLYLADVAKPGDILHPPLVSGKFLVVTTASTIEVFNLTGQKLQSQDTNHAVKSAAAGSGNYVYVGLDYSNFGRLAQYDATRDIKPLRWEFQLQAAVSSTPIYYAGTLYVADEKGLVYAVNDERQGVWPLVYSAFRTDRAIVADLKADDFGLYVASTDGRLYVLDRATGKLKWQFLAGTILIKAPTVTADTVYLPLGGGSLAAIDKTNGTPNRTARWTIDGVAQVLSEDAAFVYVSTPSNFIVAVDKKTGEPKFKSKRNDFTFFTSNTKDSTIYATTEAGEIVAIKPVLKPGTVGDIVFATPTDFEVIAAR